MCETATDFRREKWLGDGHQKAVIENWVFAKMTKFSDSRADESAASRLGSTQS